MNNDDDTGDAPEAVIQSTGRQSRPKGRRGRSGPRRAASVPHVGQAMSADQMAMLAAKAAEAVMSRMAGTIQESIDAVAARLAAIEGQPTPRRVVPPRVGQADLEPLDEEEDPDADPLSPAEQARARRRLDGGQPVPRARGMSDEEVMAMFEGEELGEFNVPLDIIPDGQAYGWWAMEVVGKENKAKEAELARRGWTDVLHEDHPGVWGTKGETGPIERKGLKLMKRSAELEALRQRYQRLLAKQAVRDKTAQMGQAPPGTGPRNHPKLANTIKRTYERLPVAEG